MAEEEGTGGALADNADIIAQYQTTRIRAFWTGYKRFSSLKHVNSRRITLFYVQNISTDKDCSADS